MTTQPGTDHRKVPRLLVVDDEPMMLDMYKSMFRSQPFACEYVHGKAKALQILDINPKFDLVLIDLMMPKQSGHDICGVLRKDYLPVELPIIGVINNNGQEEQFNDNSLGVNEYLTKPFTQIELLSRINVHLKLLELNSSFQRFIPREFLLQLGSDSIMNIDLGDQVEEEMTVLFADIRNFTTMSENLTPEQNFKFINDFLQQVTPIIRSHTGFIDKFIGDAVMALFPLQPEDAILAARAMVKTAAEMKLPESIQMLAPLKIGIGLHTGMVRLGTIGDRYRMDVTVISDAVNLASRLEALTKDYDCSIAVSADTIHTCKDPGRFKKTELGDIKVKGKAERVSVYKINCRCCASADQQIVDDNFSDTNHNNQLGSL